MALLTDEARQMVGVTSDWIYASEPVDRSAIRRFAQAVMDDNPIYWSDSAATAAGYTAVVAPPLYPLHALRRPGGVGDPLEAARKSADYDGAGDATARFGLPKLPIPCVRLLNGGNTLDIFSLATVGDLIRCQSRYLSIEEKEGRSGAFIVSILESQYQTSDGRRLLNGKQVHIWR